jgi:ubiquitin-conjugating enzyme (huntingtin interacting protein 2)
MREASLLLISICPYLRDYQTFLGTARYWTETFAKRGSLGIQEKLAKLVEMGFSEDIARSALDSCGGDENAALEKLCSG